jgi:molybdopterin molybdotransferase
MLTYQQALSTILTIPFALGEETTPLLDATGRTLASAPQARYPLPRFTQSSMDGIAIRASDTAAASAANPARLTLVGESAAGHPFSGMLQPGRATRISTGARIPDGADAVVPIEKVRLDGDSAALLESPSSPGAFIRREGEDVATGANLLARATPLGPAQIAFLASFNIPSVRTFKPPRIGIMSSGDEVKMLGAKLAETEIIGSSLYYLEREFAACGCEPRIFGISPDNAAAFRAMLEEALAWSDIVVTTAGVSVGEHDVVGLVLRDLGAELLFWRVSVRPGKPMLVARVGGKPLFGLPGNPVSTICNTEIFVKPFLRAAFGHSQPVPLLEKIRLASACQRDANRLFFTYAQRIIVDGYATASPLPRQSSANMANPAIADGLIVLEAGAEPLAAGDWVDWMPLRAGL